jgi:hypothetical protein
VMVVGSGRSRVAVALNAPHRSGATLCRMLATAWCPGLRRFGWF